MSRVDAVAIAKEPRRRRRTTSVLTLLLAGSIGTAGSGWAAAQKPDDPFALDQGIELKIEKLLYMVPPCGGSTSVEDWTRRLAKNAEIAPPTFRTVAGRERIHLDDGQPIPIELRRLEIAGRGAYSSVHFLLSRMVLLPFLIDFESLEVKAEDGGSVSYGARLVVPCHSQVGEDERPPLSANRSMESMVADHEAYLQAYHQKLTALTTGANPARLPEAVAAFDRLSAGRPVALTALRLEGGGEVSLEGAFMGGSKSFDPAPLLEQAGFRVRRNEPRDDGACRRFSIAAQLAPKAALHNPDDLQEVVLDNGPFDGRTSEVCAGAAEPSFGAIAARGAALAGKLEKPGLTIHLRDAEVTDLVRALHEATGEDFLVASELRGRVSADFEGAGLDQALAAMAEAGIAVGPGPLRTVSRAGAMGAPMAGPVSGDGGEPIEVTVQRADTAGFLCSLSTVLKRPIAYPRDLAETLTVFASDIPVRRLLEGVAALSGYSVSERGKTLVLGSAAKGAKKAAEVQACAPAPPRPGTAPAATSRLRQRLEATPELNQLAVADLELAGLVQAGDGWQAYVRAPPSRRLIRLQTETELRAAKVKEIRSDGVIFAVEGGDPVRLALLD